MFLRHDKDKVETYVKDEIQNVGVLVDHFATLSAQLTQMKYLAQGQEHEVYVSQFVDRLLEQNTQLFLYLAELNHQVVAAHFKLEWENYQTAYQDSLFPTG